ncbi:DUF4132 domain-containing protein [Lichenibacterium ramalinae]|uniref:DUF4132 domain-containing protein n=1 Tax=Lichenibacterium ramalinae TaxID=2316527 RepID=A0A4Q2RDQ2_9HYPH|nr:DUF4132 domain-containing protein [Lichenibacterium ramalinae]
MPRAIGPAGREREEAGAAIRRINAEPDGRRALAEALSRYAEAGFVLDEAVAEVLAGDELALAPDRIRPLPPWFDPERLARPELRGGGALPDEAVLAIGEVLSFSTPDHVHAGVIKVREACTDASLGRFAADLLAAWLAAGMPGQQGWAIWAVGWLGDDGSVAPLAAALQRFAACRALPQVAMAIQALTDLGSDAAVMRLGLLASKLGAKSMRAKARRHLEAMAQSRGLTREDLNDRTAPDLDLDAEGGLDLDFGPRRFRVVFDEALVPRVRDEAGRMAAVLPKPRRSDDAARAATATARWRLLKRETILAAGAILSRLDAMVGTGRRVSPEAFLACFARHPFVGQAARRLVWGFYDGMEADRSPKLTFRLAGATAVDTEDVELADVLPASAGYFGLVHPLQVSPLVLAAWRAAFARHGIAQPCRQLERPVHRLTGAEDIKTEVFCFQGIAVEPGWLRGMAARGWSFSHPVDDGLMWTIERDVVLRDGRVGVASLGFRPGLGVGRSEPGEAPRALDLLSLRYATEGAEEGPVAFHHLDRVTASEILRSLDDLAGHGRHPVPSDGLDGPTPALQ